MQSIFFTLEGRYCRKRSEHVPCTASIAEASGCLRISQAASPADLKFQVLTTMAFIVESLFARHALEAKNSGWVNSRIRYVSILLCHIYKISFQTK